MNAKADTVATLIEPTLQAMGYELVRVAIVGGAGRPTLQVMAERADGAAMSVDDCADISESISAVLDVDDPIAGAYTLEVSSPGIDRPLVKKADYDRFAGFEARVETSEPVSGRKRFRGRLLGTTEDAVRLKLDSGEDIELPLARISKAKLVLTDELIAAGSRPRT
ncbi:MAG TPA: ribosome maturation factor RimP [Alphaproteobacteria bacterium]|jgi:ribosome maturation factor RimP|nr:ribosome maturation factor RimP [Alphaproteobacteria bacterium]